MHSILATGSPAAAGGLHGCLHGCLAAGAGAAAGLPDGRAYAVATLASWLVTEGLGAYMLRSWIASGGLRPQHAGPGRVSRPVVFGHASLALTGFACWVSFVLAGSPVLAWLAIGLLAPAIGFGVSAVTLWTPYPARRAVPDDQGRGGSDGPGGDGPGEDGPPAAAVSPGQAPGDGGAAGLVTGDMLARALSDEVLSARLVNDLLARMLDAAPPAPRRLRGHLAPLIPAAHGVFALITVLLAMLAAVAAR